MEDPGHFKEYGHLISENGSCDFMSFAAWLHYDYLSEKEKVKIYPESTEGATAVIQALRDPENTYKKCAPPGFENKNLLSVLHYWDPKNIEKMLEIPNVYVILVRCTEQDTDLAIYNKLFKNWEKGREWNIERTLWSYFNDLVRNGRMDLAHKIRNVTNITDIPKELSDWIINHQRKRMVNRNKLALPTPNEKLLTLYLHEIYNDRDQLVDKIANFVGLDKNNSTYELYDAYIKSQDFILNLLKEENAKNNKLVS